MQVQLNPGQLMRTNMHALLRIVAAFGLACGVAVWAAEPPRTGSFTMTMPEAAPLAQPEAFLARYGEKPPAKEIAALAYDRSKESYDVYVPSSYDGSVAYGLMVYTSPNKGGGCVYPALMDRHHLIWIGANDVPNERNAYQRWMLAIEAVWNMPRIYNIDPRRVYGTGMSGGGRCASMTVPVFPDLFGGGALYLVGCNSQPSIVGPDAKRLGELTKNLRYALITGTKDMNQPGTKALEQEYLGSGFKHVLYLEVPDMDHAMPPAEWFEKGLIFCDSPLISEAEALLKQAEAAKAKKPEQAWRLYRSVITGFPVAIDAVATATKATEALAAAADAALGPELAKLVKETKADKLKAFVAMWEGLPVATQARDKVLAIGSAELAAIIAQKGASQRGKLEKFIAAWSGWPSADEARTAYEPLAAELLAKPLAETATEKRAKAVNKALTGLVDCPSVLAARTTLATDLDTLVGEILAIDKLDKRGRALVAFTKEWPGTTAAARAQAEIDKLIKESKPGS